MRFCESWSVGTSRSGVGRAERGRGRDEIGIVLGEDWWLAFVLFCLMCLILACLEGGGGLVRERWLVREEAVDSASESVEEMVERRVFRAVVEPADALRTMSKLV